MVRFNIRFGEVTDLQYRNHRGDLAVRRFIPIRLYYGTTIYHPGPQWILLGYDLGKKDFRDFALSGFQM